MAHAMVVQQSTPRAIECRKRWIGIALIPLASLENTRNRRFFEEASRVIVFGRKGLSTLDCPESTPETPPPVPPPTTPFGDTVAGAGIVEPSTEASGTSDVAIGSQLAGAVTKVRVRIGQEVKANDLLFDLDSRAAEADLKVRKANVAVSEAQVEVAEANVRLAEDHYDRAKSLRNMGVGAISEQDFNDSAGFPIGPSTTDASAFECRAVEGSSRAGPNSA